MKKSFKWEKFMLDCFKFILDCAICLELMVVSYIIFFIPTSFLIGFLFIDLIGISSIDILNGFGDYALLFTLCPIFFFNIWFFLEKKHIIKYRIHRLSFWFMFIVVIICWWLLAYELANGGFKN
ncbi:hypothetical protein BKN38_08210 [Helicobacter sp. CLO-3]|uniref:hypothetical protein n=1 Tax=unclassified Helicobacter TaxID=2593540 RepID=UPI000805EFF0|nr:MULTISPECIES: hypothetical protein [unclassified Helicobacter]OBV30079.1 hypothetical protein BA723_09885 [Helicobacter sp. CLO-3]OHU81867.1 hypothetical protein BKN38_08210 [Helicobacter sp. CLO-3]